MARILIVDDSPTEVFQMRKALEAGGFEVDTAADGAEAIRKVQAERPDLILMDIVMPGMDGFELLETIRKEKLAPNAVVIFLTNQGQSADIERAKKLGAAGYIVKASTIPSEVFTEVVSCIEREKGKKKK